MENASNKMWFLGVIVAVVVGAGAGYGGYAYGQRVGREKAESEFKAAQEALAQKNSEEAAKAANPFQAATNPLEGVADPLEKTKNILNPF